MKKPLKAGLMSCLLLATSLLFQKKTKYIQLSKRCKTPSAQRSIQNTFTPGNTPAYENWKFALNVSCLESDFRRENI